MGLVPKHSVSESILTKLYEHRIKQFIQVPVVKYQAIPSNKCLKR